MLNLDPCIINTLRNRTPASSGTLHETLLRTGTSGCTRVRAAYSAAWDPTWWGWRPLAPSTSGATPPPRRGSTAACPSLTATHPLYTSSRPLLQVRIFFGFLPVLRIHEILVRIWIRGSIPLTKGCGSGSCYFRR